jgi:hypothetical protein
MHPLAWAQVAWCMEIRGIYLFIFIEQQETVFYNNRRLEINLIKSCTFLFSLFLIQELMRKLWRR